ncbi:hypothetical protein DERP_013080 [Dermatophagoides pteronyssinus]|uniref:Lipoprotein n=1 Tax=Dermatophagoides pteronyssinus TaxID=6956 RepID=A0ABQ8JPX4_DERPT|nr:hypothetical protein DERP_013080 [Dermatophagoides pteronyssinus]
MENISWCQHRADLFFHGEFSPAKGDTVICIPHFSFAAFSLHSAHRIDNQSSILVAVACLIFTACSPHAQKQKTKTPANL